MKRLCFRRLEDDIVLNPFMGGGTTAIVAKRTGRNYIGFELNHESIKICNRRVGEKLIMYLV